MLLAVRQWKADEDPLNPSTWEDLRDLFIEKDVQNINEQNNLSNAGIANVAVTDEHFVDIQYQMANLAAKNEELEEHIVTLSTNVSARQTTIDNPAERDPAYRAFLAAQANVATVRRSASAAKAATATTVNKSEMEATIERVLGRLNLTNVGGRGNDGGRGRGDGARNPRTPSPRYIFYCDSHGCQPRHYIKDCDNKKLHHNDNATFSKPKNLVSCGINISTWVQARLTCGEVGDRRKIR